MQTEENLRKELEVTDKLLDDRNRLLDLFECPEHGKQCVPFAMEEVARLRLAAISTKPFKADCGECADTGTMTTWGKDAQNNNIPIGHEPCDQCQAYHTKHTANINLEIARNGRDIVFNRGCPCNYAEPCMENCSCVHPFMSHGCLRCCTYGSEVQRTKMAEGLVNALAPLAPDSDNRRQAGRIVDNWLDEEGLDTSDLTLRHLHQLEMLLAAELNKVITPNTIRLRDRINKLKRVAKTETVWGWRDTLVLCDDLLKMIEDK